MENLLIRKPGKREAPFYTQVFKGIYLKKWESVERYWATILWEIFKGRDWYISDRTALEFKPYNGKIFIRAGKYNKTLRLGHLSIEVSPLDKYPKVVNYDKRKWILVACYELALLQNCLEYSKGRVLEKKELISTIKKGKPVDTQLIDTLTKTNNNYKKAKERFFFIYGQIKWTQSIENEIYIQDIELVDGNRIKMFEELSLEIQKNIVNTIPDKKFALYNPNFENYCFWESYYSNYIEGTRFEIQEAVEIIKKPESYTWGPEWKNIYKLYKTLIELYPQITESIRIDTYENFKQLIQNLHKSMQEGILPSAGKLKTRVNTNGAKYEFVHPTKVDATLREAFFIGQRLHNDYQRAIFYHFVISECHPFEDGNGRLARTILNFYIVKAGLHPLIVTSKVRSGYLSGLSKISKNYPHSQYEYYITFFTKLIHIIYESDFSQDTLDPHNYMAQQYQEEEKEPSSLLQFLYN